MSDFCLENNYNGPVCGLDEVGRGPLAGPVVAACVFVPEGKRSLPFVSEIRDSKKLSPQKLLYLFACIQEHFVWGLGECSPVEIDAMNILQASLTAMERAFEQMIDDRLEMIDAALVDGKFIARNLPCAAQAVVKGDSKSVSIAAASIVAKVTRDRLMHSLAAQNPHYGWERNVGYPTREHLEAIERFGITDHHRRSFGPVRKFLEKELVPAKVAKI